MLTKRQKQVLDFVKKFIQEHDYAPSLEEIKKHLKISSVSTVHFHIINLEKEGYIIKDKNEPRGIKVDNVKENLAEIPLVGTIAAGQPIEAIANPETIKVQKNLLSRSGDHFALRVQGDSMIGEGIFDSDMVVIRKQPTAENGETVVALINDNEVTLKKLYREKSGFRLQPANPSVKPIFTKNLVIQGKVISVIRSFGELKEKIKEKEEFDPRTVKYIEETNIQHRKSFGQYFTPRSVREALLKKLPNNTNKPKVLDQACGTGEFLITAKEHFRNAVLHGWDIDKKLVEITNQTVPEARLKHIDALLNEDHRQYDFVIGNPPYFEFTPSKEIKEKFKRIINGRVNIFSLFVYQGLNLLKDGGYLAFVVPPSMNNGAYFLKLREFIIDNSNIEYLHVLDSSKIFRGALQSTMLLVLKKGKNKGSCLFRKNGILIFSENTNYLNKAFRNKLTLHDLGYKTKTGRLTWNQNRHLLTNKEAIPLIWSHNITAEGLKFPIINKKKPQYVKIKDFDIGPAIVVNRIAGSVKSSKLKTAIIPAGMKFIAENHVNVIFPPIKQRQIKLNLENQLSKTKLTIQNIAQQISSDKKLNVLKNITGNTQLSKTELQKLFPIDPELNVVSR